MNIHTAPPGMVRELWPHIVPHIEKALEFGWNTSDEVLALLEAAQAQCWFVVDDGKVIGSWITRIEQSERGRFCLLWLAGGDRLHEWLHLVGEHTEPWAKENGCTQMQIVGRKGWVKRLPDYKWTSIVLRKDL